MTAGHDDDDDDDDELDMGGYPHQLEFFGNFCSGFENSIN
jgi:hypothetical protein